MNSYKFFLLYSILIIQFFFVGLIYSSSDCCPRAKGTWNKEWCWDWSQIHASDVEFPKDFLWGSGTSAYQVEGNCTNNNWSLVEDQINEDGTSVLPEESGSACDHWNRYKEDIQLMKNIGLNAYRFSVEWSKIEWEEGAFDEDALQHYADVCDELLLQGIKPVIGLHHYTDPIWFAEMGGFEKEENIKFFVRFSQKVFEKLKSKACMWITFNSPDAYAIKGYMQALMPPFKKDWQLMGQVYKNLLEAHVRTYQKLKRSAGDKEHKIGIMKNVFQLEPQGILGNVACFMARHIKENCFYRFFTTGKFRIYLPFKINVKHVNKQARESLDFVGISYYSHAYMKNFKVKPDENRVPTNNPLYTIYGEGLYRAIQEVSELLTGPLNIPIYITENGTAALSDEHRDLFFKQYLFALSTAIRDGYDVRGYFYWSIMDNYEWGRYEGRYGLYHVDFETQMRTLKKGTEHFVDVVNPS